MDIIQAELSVSISELKRNPSAIIEQANGQPVVIFNHNRPSAYLVSVSTYETINNQHKKGLATSIRKRFAELQDITENLELPSRNDQPRKVEF